MAGKIFNISGGGSALSDCLKALPSGSSSADPHIVWVAPGVYDPILNWNATKPVRVVATGSKDETIIDGGGTSKLVEKTNSSYSGINIMFQGLTLRNGYLEASEDDGNWSSCVGYYMTFIDCHITNCVHINTGTLKSYSNSITHLAMNCVFRNCEIDNTSTNNIGWRYSSFTGCDIHHNTMTGTNGDGYSFGTVNRCRVHDNLCMTYMLSGGSNSLFYDNDVKHLFERPNTLHNCVVFRNKGRLIDNFGMGGAAYNNIFFNNSPKSTALPSNTTLYNFYNYRTTRICNNVFDSIAGWNGQKSSNWAMCEGNLTGVSEPGFIDADNLDFHLKSDSVAVAAGISTIYSASDTPTESYIPGTLDFESRTYLDPPSCGAFQYRDETRLYLPVPEHPMGV